MSNKNLSIVGAELQRGGLRPVTRITQKKGQNGTSPIRNKKDTTFNVPRPQNRRKNFGLTRVEIYLNSRKKAIFIVSRRRGRRLSSEEIERIDKAVRKQVGYNEKTAEKESEITPKNYKNAPEELVALRMTMEIMMTRIGILNEEIAKLRGSVKSCNVSKCFNIDKDERSKPFGVRSNSARRVDISDLARGTFDQNSDYLTLLEENEFGLAFRRGSGQCCFICWENRKAYLFEHHHEIYVVLKRMQALKVLRLDEIWQGLRKCWLDCLKDQDLG